MTSGLRPAATIPPTDDPSSIFLNKIFFIRDHLLRGALAPQASPRWTGRSLSRVDLSRRERGATANKRFKLSLSCHRKRLRSEWHHNPPPLQHPKGRFLGLHPRPRGAPVIAASSLITIARITHAVAIDDLSVSAARPLSARSAALLASTDRHPRRYTSLATRATMATALAPDRLPRRPDWTVKHRPHPGITPSTPPYLARPSTLSLARRSPRTTPSSRPP